MLFCTLGIKFSEESTKRVKNRRRLLRNFPRQKFMYLKFQYELTTFPLFQAYIGGKKSDYEVSRISNTEFSRYRCLKLLMSFKFQELAPVISITKLAAKSYPTQVPRLPQASGMILNNLIMHSPLLRFSHAAMVLWQLMAMSCHEKTPSAMPSAPNH
jgi:hypothetical protein